MTFGSGGEFAPFAPGSSKQQRAGKASESRIDESIVMQTDAEGRSAFAASLLPDVLTVREVARALRVCTATVYSMIESGALPHFRVVNSIRVRAADLALLAASQADGGEP